MKIIQDSWNLVIVGKWNRFILTPEWVGVNIFNEKEFEVAIPVNRPDVAPRYKFSDNIVFAPSVHRCQFIAPEPYSDKMLSRICELSLKLVKILPHTPINAIGINFAFSEEITNFSRMDIFNINDRDKYAEKDLVIENIEVKRQVVIDKGILNFKVSKDNKFVSLNFNFHYPVDKIEKIDEVLKGTIMSSCRDIAFDILKSIYNLDPNNSEE